MSFGRVCTFQSYAYFLHLIASREQSLLAFAAKKRWNVTYDNVGGIYYFDWVSSIPSYNVRKYDIDRLVVRTCSHIAPTSLGLPYSSPENL